MSRPFIASSGIILLVLLLAGEASLRAQQINPRNPPPPPPAEPASTPPGSSPAAPASSPAAPTATPPVADAKPIDPTVPPPPPPADDPVQAAPSGPTFDPLHAQRSLDVGTFYFRKGAYDAAIDRFLEAANYQPSLAAPWKLLGEAYEKKREFAKAADAYNKYLQLLPNAPDAAKIQKTVADLQEKSAQDSTRK